jgi:hypothetical protein
MATKKKAEVQVTEENEEVEGNKYQGGEIPHEPKVEERSPGSNEEAASYTTD